MFLLSMKHRVDTRIAPEVGKEAPVQQTSRFSHLVLQAFFLQFVGFGQGSWNSKYLGIPAESR